MQRYRPFIFLLVIFIAAVAVAFWGAAWWNYLRSRPVQPAGPKPAGQATAPAPGARPREEVVIQNQTVQHTEQGRLAWQVQLTQLKVAAGSQSVAATGLREALIYDKNGAPIIRLTAQTVKGNTTDKNLEVAGDVRAASQRGALITTSRVRWLEKERRLFCPEKVTFRGQNAALTTTGLSYYVDADTVKAPNEVRLYSGDNKVIGRQLVYNVKTTGYEMKNIQAFLNPQQRPKSAP